MFEISTNHYRQRKLLIHVESRQNGTNLHSLPMDANLLSRYFRYEVSSHLVPFCAFSESRDLSVWDVRLTRKLFDLTFKLFAGRIGQRWDKLHDL